MVYKEGKNSVIQFIEFREFENICREGVLEKGILELVSKIERFEVLLVLEEIRLDLLKFVIFVFCFLCLVNIIMNENVEKLLCFIVVKKFIIGMVFLEFINLMFFLESGWKDESDCVVVLNDLVGIFFELFQKFGESIVYKLLFFQVSMFWKEMKKKNLIEDISDFDKKI